MQVRATLHVMMTSMFDEFSGHLWTTKARCGKKSLSIVFCLFFANAANMSSILWIVDSSIWCFLFEWAHEREKNWTKFSSLWNIHVECFFRYDESIREMFTMCFTESQRSIARRMPLFIADLPIKHSWYYEIKCFLWSKSEIRKQQSRRFFFFAISAKIFALLQRKW